MICVEAKNLLIALIKHKSAGVWGGVITPTDAITPRSEMHLAKMTSDCADSDIQQTWSEL